jgi:hypothetical protein
MPRFVLRHAPGQLISQRLKNGDLMDHRLTKQLVMILVSIRWRTNDMELEGLGAKLYKLLKLAS